MHLCRLARHSRMTEIAAFDGPGYFSVMASATILTVDNFQHIDLIAARFHLESKICMADLASEADAMKPVRKNDRAHACSLRVIIDQYIAVFGL